MTPSLWPGKQLKWPRYPRLETRTLQTIIDQFHCSPSFLKSVSMSLTISLRHIYSWEAVYHLSKAEIKTETETSVIQTTDEILNAIDKKKLTAVVLLDLSKAFDSIDHQILLAKLQDIGASRPAIEWFGSYLTSRHQFVQINTTLSTKLPVISGVPQGSILGPLLFNIYVNDLPSVPENCSSQCYVNDTKLLMSFQLHNQHEAIAKLNKDLLSFRNWCFDNQLLLNPDKTKLVIFGNRQMTAKISDFRLFLLGKELEPVKAARDLGVTLDSNLTYNEHIFSTVSTCMSRLGQINRVKHIFDKRALSIVINALVFSKLFYCSSVWSNTTQANLDKLQAVQNFACRILCGAKKFDHITPLLKDLCWQWDWQIPEHKTNRTQTSHEKWWR